MNNCIAAILARAALAALALCTLAPRRAGAEGERAPVRALDGGALYRRHCASCHGMDGSGNGPNAELFAIRPRDLHEGFLAKYSNAELVRRIRDGRPLELPLDRAALQRRAADVEALAAYLDRLPAIDWDALSLGWTIYAARCEGCHGPFGSPVELRDDVRRPPDFRDPRFQLTISDSQLLMAVVHGRKGMPALVPRLNPSEALALLAFVRHLSPAFETYTQYCAVCHGDDGRGSESFGEGMPGPSVVFDRAYFRRTRPEDLRAAVWHMVKVQLPSMPHFRDVLSETEARAIVEFLKTRDALHQKDRTE